MQPVIDLVYDLLGLAFWVGSIGLVLWWVWGMRKAGQPRRRTPREEAELASLRAAVDRDQDRLLGTLPPVTDDDRPTR